MTQLAGHKQKEELFFSVDVHNYDAFDLTYSVTRIGKGLAWG